MWTAHRKHNALTGELAYRFRLPATSCLNKNAQQSRMKAFLSFFFAVLVTIDLVCNVLVCTIVLRNRPMQRPLNILLANLALANVIIGAFILPQHVFNHAFQHPVGSAGDTLCKFITGGSFIWMSAAASAILLIAIALERYCAVVLPTRNKYRLNRKRVLWVMGFCWGFACLLSVPSIAAIKYNSSKDFCEENWPGWYFPKVHVAFVFSVNCAIPILTMTFLYSRIIYKLWRHQPQRTTATQTAQVKVRRRVTIMLLIVTAVHTSCWSPNYILYLLIFVTPHWSYGSTIYNYTVLLMLLNSAADPFLYAWYIDGFRRSLRNMFCYCRRNRLSPQIAMRASVGQSSVGVVPYNIETQGGEEGEVKTSAMWCFY